MTGTILYHLYNFWIPDGSNQTYIKPAFDLHFGLPLPSLEFVDGILPALKYLPITIPFAVLTVVGGINVTESAGVAGDDYSARQILLTEAWTTLLAGVCGGVAQSCPYIGHPAYKRMGARAGYTLLTAIFVGLGGVLGYVSFIVELIPKAVLAPILVFISLEIVAQAFTYSPTRHIPAVIMAMFPTVSRLVSIQLENSNMIPVQNLHDMMSRVGSSLPEALIMIALGNGFILTGMLWGSFLAEMIDHHFKRCSFYLAIGRVFIFWYYSLLLAGRECVFPLAVRGSSETDPVSIWDGISLFGYINVCPLLYKRKPFMANGSRINLTAEFRTVDRKFAQRPLEHMF